jgi:hypothetical protein
MKGWTQESKRHSLARQGVKTGRKVNAGHSGIVHRSIKEQEWAAAAEREAREKIDFLIDAEWFDSDFVKFNWSSRAYNFFYYLEDDEMLFVQGQRQPDGTWAVAKATFDQDDVFESELKLDIYDNGSTALSPVNGFLNAEITMLKLEFEKDIRRKQRFVEKEDDELAIKSLRGQIAAYKDSLEKAKKFKI